MKLVYGPENITTHFRVWPAIDLAGGKAVRLRQGAPESAWVVSDDPLALAQRLWEAGVYGLHVVDLDAALGQGNNNALVEKLCHAGGGPVQVAGGVRGQSRYWELRRLGAYRVVVGSWAVQCPEDMDFLAKADPERLVVAADVRGGRVVFAGWRQTAPLTLQAFARRMRQAGVRHLLVTAVERDGTGEGPDFALLREALEAFGPGVLAAGGVGSREHLVALRAMAHQGLEGVVVGAALARGQLTLQDLRLGS
jgi:phosphoribosylformimino-5-aminoimidazole carboxamide ribotide isomerase